MMLLDGVNFEHIKAAEGNPDAGIISKNPEISLTLAVSALAVLIFSGALAGILPARRATKMKTIDALRDE